MESNTKTCIACGSALHKSASICNVCSSYKSRLKNEIIFLAKSIGLITAVLVGFGYLSKVTGDFLSDHRGIDVVHLDLATRRTSRIILVNHSTNEAIATRILTYIEYKDETLALSTRSINVVTKGRSISSQELSVFPDAKPLVGAHFLVDITDDRYSYNMEKIMDELKHNHGESDCLSYTIELDNMRNTAPVLGGRFEVDSLKVYAGLTYYSAGSSKQRYRTLPVTLSLNIKSTKECSTQFEVNLPTP